MPIEASSGSVIRLTNRIGRQPNLGSRCRAVGYPAASPDDCPGEDARVGYTAGEYARDADQNSPSGGRASRVRRVTKRMPNAIAQRRLSRGRLGTTPRAMGTAAEREGPRAVPERKPTRFASSPSAAAESPAAVARTVNILRLSRRGPAARERTREPRAPKASTPQFAFPAMIGYQQRVLADKKSRRGRSCSPFRGTTLSPSSQLTFQSNPAVAFPSSATTRRSSALRFVSGAEPPPLRPPSSMSSLS